MPDFALLGFQVRDRLFIFYFYLVTIAAGDAYI